MMTFDPTAAILLKLATHGPSYVPRDVAYVISDLLTNHESQGEKKKCFLGLWYVHAIFWPGEVYDIST